MTERGEEESYEALADLPAGRPGLRVKLESGFQEGVYSINVHYDELAEGGRNPAARAQARAYAGRLREQLGRVAEAQGYQVGELEDPSPIDLRRPRDLEYTFLFFVVTSTDGRCHNADLAKHLRAAVVRVGQEADQDQSCRADRRRAGSRVEFQERLGRLLTGAPYRHLDAATRKRLLKEVPEVAFPPPGRER